MRLDDWCPVTSREYVYNMYSIIQCEDMFAVKCPCVLHFLITRGHIPIYTGENWRLISLWFQPRLIAYVVYVGTCTVGIYQCMSIVDNLVRRWTIR